MVNRVGAAVIIRAKRQRRRSRTRSLRIAGIGYIKENKLATHVVGIDLGTTHSVVAHLDAQGHPQTVFNSEGDATTPSVVFFDRSSVVVGKEAVKATGYEPHRIAQFAKRDMGRSAYHRPIDGEQIPPEIVLALILRKLKGDTELKLNAVNEAVITVPAFYNEPRRKATQDAGRLAGLTVLDIINEPTAAAIAYGVQQGFLTGSATAREPEMVLVYDLGGGTFDVTLMKIDGRHYEAMATAGDIYLGGIDWDRRIAQHVAREFCEQFGVDPLDDLKSEQRLMREADEAKRALTARDEVTLHFEHAGHTLRLLLTRGQFEELTVDLIERTRFTTRKLLRESQLEWSDVTRVILVGGASRMPMVCKSLEADSGKHLDRSLSPDEAVAHGAAIYASILASQSSSERPKLAVRNVNSHDLGVLGMERSTGRHRRHVLIRRNTPLPAIGAAQFTTKKDDQSCVVVPVIEGGDASGKGATSIGKCVISNLPLGLPAGTRVEVLFGYASNGRLNVKARLPTADREANLFIERTSGLSETLLEQWEERIRAGLQIGRSDPEAKPSDQDDESEYFDELDMAEQMDEKNGELVIRIPDDDEDEPSDEGDLVLRLDDDDEDEPSDEGDLVDWLDDEDDEDDEDLQDFLRELP